MLWCLLLYTTILNHGLIRPVFQCLLLGWKPSPRRQQSSKKFFNLSTHFTCPPLTPLQALNLSISKYIANNTRANFSSPFLTLSHGLPYTKNNRHLQKKPTDLTAQKMESSQGRYNSQKSRETGIAIQAFERSRYPAGHTQRS